MPKVKMNDDVRKDRLLIATIEKYKSFYAYPSYKSIALKTQIGTSTIYSRMKSPEDFTLRELRRLARLFHFSQDEILQMF